MQCASILVALSYMSCPLIIFITNTDPTNVSREWYALPNAIICNVFVDVLRPCTEVTHPVSHQYDSEESGNNAIIMVAWQLRWPTGHCVLLRMFLSYSLTSFSPPNVGGRMADHHQTPPHVPRLPRATYINVDNKFWGSFSPYFTVLETANSQHSWRQL